MTTNVVFFILILVALALFIVYNFFAIKQFGIPESLSNTYYLYEAKHKGYGWFFTAYMWVTALLLLPGWIVVSENMGVWMSYFTFLAAFTCFGIAFVGTAPKFHEDAEGKVHVISAIITSVSAMLLDFIVCWHIWYVPLIGCMIPVVAATWTKTWKTSKTYWLEMMAFVGSFVTIITENIIQLCNA